MLQGELRVTTVQSKVCLTADLGGRKFESQLEQVTFVEIDQDIISVVRPNKKICVFRVNLPYLIFLVKPRKFFPVLLG